MDAFLTMELAVPVSQIALLLFLSTVALLFGRVKLALLVNYLFTLYWGYFLNRDMLMGAAKDIPHFTYIYFGIEFTVPIHPTAGNRRAGSPGCATGCRDCACCG